MPTLRRSENFPSGRSKTSQNRGFRYRGPYLPLLVGFASELTETILSLRPVLHAPGDQMMTLIPKLRQDRADPGELQ